MKNKEPKNHLNKLDTTQKKEIIITIIVILIAIVIGVFGGRALYETMYGPI